MLKYKQIWHEIKLTKWLIKFNLTYIYIYMFQLHINLFSLTIGLGFDEFVLSFFAITKECFVFGVDRDIIMLKLFSYKGNEIK